VGLAACGGNGGGNGNGGGENAESDLIPIRYGAPRADYYPLYVAREQGLFEEAGLAPEFFFFDSGAPLLAALKSGELDVITTGLGSMFAVGQGVDLTFLMWHIDDAAAEGLVMTNDSGITSYEELGKASTLAAAQGTCATVNLYLAAQEAGIPWESLNTVNIPPPLYDSAMRQGSIQGGIAWAPFGQQLEARGVGEIVAFDETYGGVCPVTTSVRTDFLNENPDVGTRLVKVQDLARQKIEQNPQLAIDALVRELKLSPEVAKETFEQLETGFPTFEKQLDPSSPQSIVDPNGLAGQLHKASVALAETGNIPEPLSQQELFDRIDASYLEKYVQEEK
jgi:NitT/TauT family transport system substrate-binding protein